MIIAVSTVIVFAALIGILGLYNIEKLKHDFELSNRIGFIANSLIDIRTLLVKKVRLANEYAEGRKTKEKAADEISECTISLNIKINELRSYLPLVSTLTEEDVSRLASLIKKDDQLVKGDQIAVRKGFDEHIEYLDTIFLALYEKLPLQINTRVCEIITFTTLS